MTTLASKTATAALALALASTGVVLGTPGAANAAPTDLVSVQRRLITSANAISASAVSAASGLAGISARPERGQVWVYWKGQVPEHVQREVDAQGGRIIPAAYSERELLDAMDRVVKAGAHGIVEMGPMPDGSGLSIAVTGTQASAAVAAAGVAVRVTTGARMMTLASRQIDGSPKSAGAKFLWDLNGGTYRCTTGIPIVQRGVRKMLTAGHCGSNGTSIKRGDGVAWGVVEQDSDARDTMLIDPIGRHSISSKIYEGPHTSNTKKDINFGALDSFVDTLVCTSGAMTGEHCKIRIKAKNQMIWVLDANNNPYSMSPMVKAEHDDHGVAAGTGDSGGPVVAQDSSGPAPFKPGDFVNVYPMGTISAIDPETVVPCGSSDSASATCAWRMWYAGIMDSLDHYNATTVVA